MPTLLHLLPRFPPIYDGVGDYARQLAALLEEAGWRSRFLVSDPAWKGSSREGGFEVEKLPANTGPALAETLARLKPDVLLVHYVTYGYHPKGAPLWFRAGFDGWRKGAGAGTRVVTLFHELWASGPPWTSACYSGLIQRWLVRRMLAGSDAALTSNRRMQRLLDRITPGKTALQPIPSSLPVPPPGSRPPHGGTGMRLILFGQEGQRLHSLRTHLGLIRALAAAGLLDTLRLVGRGARAGAEPSRDVALLRAELPEVAPVVVGDATPAEAAKQFLGSDFFLSGYPASLACKSSTVTSALACGCIPVMPDSADAAPLAPGTHFLACDSSPAGVQLFLENVRSGSWKALSEAGPKWYREEADWSVVAPRVERLLSATLPTKEPSA